MECSWLLSLSTFASFNDLHLSLFFLHLSSLSFRYVSDLTKVQVKNSQEAQHLILSGAEKRHVGSTKMNAQSSRSHTIFTLYVERNQLVNGTHTKRTSKLNLIDLAGSECQKNTGAGNIHRYMGEGGAVFVSLHSQSNRLLQLECVSRKHRISISPSLRLAWLSMLLSTWHRGNKDTFHTGSILFFHFQD